MLTRGQLKEMSGVALETADKRLLADAGSVKLDYSLPKDERIESYLSQIKNPYCFRLGDMCVKLAFPQDAPSLQELFARFCAEKKAPGPRAGF